MRWGRHHRAVHGAANRWINRVAAAVHGGEGFRSRYQLTLRCRPKWHRGAARSHVGPGYSDIGRNTGTFEQGWLISGDLGHVDAEGRLFVTGRAKDVIIRGSHNIDPAIIEDALLQHPDVAIAAAVGAPDAYAGELPVAFVTLKAGATVDGEGLRRYLAPIVSEPAALP